MLIAPPKASAPRLAGTTPLYISTRSIIFTGKLASEIPLPFASSGIPSIKYLTELPDSPLMERSKSEPTPPSSLILMPAVRLTISFRFFKELICGFISNALTVRAPSLTFCVFDLPYTSTVFRVTEFSSITKSSVLFLRISRVVFIVL